MTLPTILIIITTGFFAWERVFLGRKLPNSKGWYVRSIVINLIQLGLMLVTGQLLLGVRFPHEFDLANVRPVINPVFSAFS